MSEHAAEHSHGHHVDSPKLYYGTFALLTVLMLLTIGASQVHFPGGSIVNNLIAMTIAVLKAALVVAIFMGVRKGSGLIKLYALGGFVWFFLFFIMFCDYMTRSWEPVKGWVPKDAPMAVDYPYVTDTPGERPAHEATAGH